MSENAKGTEICSDNSCTLDINRNHQPSAVLVSVLVPVLTVLVTMLLLLLLLPRLQLLRHYHHLLLLRHYHHLLLFLLLLLPLRIHHLHLHCSNTRRAGHAEKNGSSRHQRRRYLHRHHH
jgi:hypothetical protein